VTGGKDEADSKSSSEQEAGDPEETERPGFGALLSDVPAEIRDVSFSSAVRGYDRREVDAYVERVNRVIAELEISRSPQSAVKHALDRVGEQTSGVLQRAREVAEELTSTALAEAEHATRRAKVEAEETIEKARMQAHQLRGQSKEEADEILAGARTEATESVKRAEQQARTLHADAEARLHTLKADIEAAAEERRRVLDELRRTASDLEGFASGALGGQSGEAGGPPGERPTEKLPPRPAVAPEADTADSKPRTHSAETKPAGRMRDRKLGDPTPVFTERAADDRRRSPRTGGGSRRKG
jgi:DivIVA domain-containing protein